MPSFWQHSWRKHPWLIINLWIQIQSPKFNELYLFHTYYSCSKSLLFPDTSSLKLPAPCAPHCPLVLACSWWWLCKNCTQGEGWGKVYNGYQFITVLRSDGADVYRIPCEITEYCLIRYWLCLIIWERRNYTNFCLCDCNWITCSLFFFKIQATQQAFKI